MTSKHTELVFILDRSGSMAGLESDTIGGFNGMLAKQQKLPGECYVTTILFDDKYEVLHDHRDIRTIKPLTAQDYTVRGSTALYDAMGITIHRIGNRQKFAAPDQWADQVLITIITDGFENSSIHYQASEIRQMVTRQQHRFDWQFIFMGANMDAIAAAGHLGIDPQYAADYVADAHGTQVSYAAMDDALHDFRSTGHIHPGALNAVRSDARHRKQK